MYAVDEKNKKAKCSNCGPVPIKKKGKVWRCRVAIRQEFLTYWRKKHPPVEKATMLDQQYAKKYRVLKGKLCEICGDTKRLCADHSHKTKDYRGTLCSPCNLALGLFKDSPHFLRKAVEYLERQKAT